MIHIEFDVNALPNKEKLAFENWKSAAELAKKRFSAGEEPLQARVWGALKDWLLRNIFHGKCAYCEMNIVAGFFGDADHYRPKGAVTEFVDGRLVKAMRNGKPHEGYYWLAYEWRNLIPACSRCNTVRGKRAQFPVRGRRIFSMEEALDIDELDRIEQPALLHPYIDDPSEHIVFANDGTAVGLTEKGEETIRVVDLNREDLVGQRRDYMKAQINSFILCIGSLVGDKNTVKAELDKFQAKLCAPDKQFSAASRDAIGWLRSQLAP